MNRCSSDMKIDNREVAKDTTEKLKVEAPDDVYEWPIMRLPRTKIRPQVPTQLTLDAVARASFNQDISAAEYMRIYRSTSREVYEP